MDVPGVCAVRGCGNPGGIDTRNVHNGLIFVFHLHVSLQYVWRVLSFQDVLTWGSYGCSWTATLLVVVETRAASTPGTSIMSSVNVFVWRVLNFQDVLFRGSRGCSWTAMLLVVVETRTASIPGKSIN